MSKRNSIFPWLIISLGSSLLMLITWQPATDAVMAAPPHQPTLWQDVSETSLPRTLGRRLIIPRAYRLLQVDLTALDAILAQAPLEHSATARNKTVTLPLPLPNGQEGLFRIEESPLMPPKLARKFPTIKTYHGWGLNDPTATVRLDRTPAGFHALILSAAGAIYIDPYRTDDVTHYLSYFSRDYQDDKRLIEIILDEPSQPRFTAPTGRTTTGDFLRTYRLALAATGEYTQFHGGTVGQGMAAVITTLNRVVGIYRRELAVTFMLVENNDQLIYVNPQTDPYTDNNGLDMLSQNQANIDRLIGDDNYDIGHVFSTGGGGIASAGVCRWGRKAQGVTGQAKPIGDPFDVDYVAHEMGHQFHASHTFNADGEQNGSCNGNRVGWTAYEPGSGSTIMAYAGICGNQNLQKNSQPYFHTISFQQIASFLNDPNGGDLCGEKQFTGNTPPTVEAGENFTIPANTPFTLEGSATDPDGDSLTYAWEQFDLGPAWTMTTLPNTDLGSGPIFRSYPPLTTPRRTFPNFEEPFLAAQGEALPTTSRTLHFQLTARDGRGGVNYDRVTVNVAGQAGPFRITSPKPLKDVWSGQSSQTVLWEVAGTDEPPVNCETVDILLSTDNGQTFPYNLATATPNDGSTNVTVPAIETNTGQLKVACTTSNFFALTEDDFTIVTDDRPVLTLQKRVTISGTFAHRGDPLTYTIAMANIGPVAANNLYLSDTLPLGVVGPSLEVTTSLASQQHLTYTLTGTLATDAPVAELIINTAYLSHPTGNRQAVAHFTTADVPANLISRLILEPANPLPGEPVVLQVVVTNTGESRARFFYVDVYINPLEPPTGGLTWQQLGSNLRPIQGLEWFVDALIPGQVITLTSESNGPQPPEPSSTAWSGSLVAGTTELYSYADTWDDIREVDEIDNRFELRLSSVAPDQKPIFLPLVLKK